MATFKTTIQHQKGTVIEVFGEHFRFDDSGYGTLTTDRPDVIERLRSIPEGFVEVDAQPKEDRATEATGFVLTKPDGQTLDLSLLDDHELRLFVADHGLKVHGRAKGDTLRRAIVEALKAAGA